MNGERGMGRVVGLPLNSYNKKKFNRNLEAASQQLNLLGVTGLIPIGWAEEAFCTLKVISHPWTGIPLVCRLESQEKESV